MRAGIAAILLTSIAIAGPARADGLTVRFGGVFTQFNNSCSPLSAPFPGNCATSPIATAFSGSFSYTTGASPSYTGVTLTSDAFASLGLATTLTGTPSPNGYDQEIGTTLRFGNLLGSQFATNLATLVMTYPSSVTPSLSAPPPLSAATGGTFSFVTSASPGGTGPSLSGTVTSFLAGGAGSAVPEAAIWATMLSGLAVAGAGLRRRRARVRVAYA